MTFIHPMIRPRPYAYSQTIEIVAFKIFSTRPIGQSVQVQTLRIIQYVKRILSQFIKTDAVTRTLIL